MGAIDKVIPDVKTFESSLIERDLSQEHSTGDSKDKADKEEEVEKKGGGVWALGYCFHCCRWIYIESV